MILIAISMVQSLLVIALVWHCSRREKPYAPVLTALVLIGVVQLFALPAAIMLISPAATLQTLATFVVLAVMMLFRTPAKVFPWTAAVIAVAVSGIMLWHGLNRLHERRAIRSEFPLESMAERLTNETPATETDESAVSLAADLETRLTAREQAVSEARYQPRIYSLRNLHATSIDSFVAAQGFGVSRMWLMTDRKEIEIPAAPPVLLPDPPYVPTSPPAPTGADRLPLARALPSRPDLLALHDGGASDFLDPVRMGWIRDRENVAGFTAHRMEKIPAPDSSDQPSTAPALAQWRIVRLELVSLLKHATPVVYVSKKLPQMEELKRQPTRPLNAFEQASLARLRRDEDLVVQESPPGIRMLGALRASQDCRECHTVRRGELLGAFSYELAPTQPIPAKPANTTPAG